MTDSALDAPRTPNDEPGSNSEPTNVGPIAGGSLRASDADREQVVTVLSTAYAEGRITREEHDERLDQVMKARTFDDLMPITHDLVPIPAAASVPKAQTTPYAIEEAGANDETEYLVGVFGAATRKGTWRIRKKTTALAVFGAIDLDLREATFEAPVIEVNGLWCFGALDIKAPAGLRVEDRTIAIFGGSDVSNLDNPQPGAPTLVVKGLALFGGVSVRGPKPDKAERKARRHHGC